MSGSDFAPPSIITGDKCRFTVTAQLAAIGTKDETILVEPSAQNTAPAVLASALWLHQDNPEALMLLSLSDHVIPDVKGFSATVLQGVAAAIRHQARSSRNRIRVA